METDFLVTCPISDFKEIFPCTYKFDEVSMSNQPPKNVPNTEAAFGGGPPKPPGETNRAFEDGGDDPGLTRDEWTVLERFHKKGDIESWNQRDKIVLTSALKKAHAQPTAYLEKALRWIEEGSNPK